MLNISKKIILENSGIYCIKNKINNKVYIGSSINLYSRLQSHKSKLNNNKHENKHLQRSFNKHGIENFEVKVLEYCDKDINILYKKENYHYNLYKNTYNQRIIVESNLGIKKETSLKTRLKQSLALKGKIPKNLKYIQEKRKKKIVKYINNKIIKIYDSCKEAADDHNMKANNFNQYIGIRLKQKSKHFNINTYFDYYET
jgi:hypothetical protein